MLYLCRRSSRAGKKKTVPSLPTALCSPGLRSWTAARERVIVISVHRGCSLLRTLLQPATALVSPVSCPPSLATDNDEPSLEPALWSPLQLLQTSSVRTQLATSARWSRGPVTTAILFSNCDIDVHWYIINMVPIKHKQYLQYKSPISFVDQAGWQRDLMH